MYSNSKDQQSIENLYSKILKEDFESSHEAEERPIHPEETPSNVPTSGESTSDKVKNLIRSGKLDSVNTDDEEHINNLLAEFGLSDDAEEEANSSDYLSPLADKDAEEDYTEELPRESYSTAGYLAAAGKKKEVLKESGNSTARYLK